MNSFFLTRRDESYNRSEQGVKKNAPEKLWISVFSHRMKNGTHENANAILYELKGERRNHAGV
jgi:hypothetical protein